MQHDTSPHRARIGGVLTGVHSASLVLCYSRMIFFQHYPSNVAAEDMWREPLKHTAVA
jgi:hypothetical protein